MPKQRKMVLLLLLGSDDNARSAQALVESLKNNADIKTLTDSLGRLQNKLATAIASIENEITSFESSNDQVSYHTRIMMLRVDSYIKSKAIDKLKEANSGRESGAKAQQYIDGLLRVPFGVYKSEPIFSSKCIEEKRVYIKNVNTILNTCVHGHDEAKQHIERLIAQWINGKQTGTVFGFQGPPGTGKTTLAKNGFAKCLVDENGDHRPMAFLPLGGSSSGSLLEGHGYTYMGSTWGKVVDTLMESQCMNPIIYIDEIDKVSASERGQEIIGILTHLTDPSQNTEFNDRYYSGVKFDLSRAIFIFSYNDASKIDRVLRDRIHEIHTSSLSKQDKITIARDYLLADILENTGMGDDSLLFEDSALEHMIDSYTNEAGVRKLKELIYDIVRATNLDVLQGVIKLPLRINVSYIDTIFEKRPKALFMKTRQEPCIGIVNGLYASSTGAGGITLIEVHKTVGENMELLLTGSQGTVMKESMQCALTLAWNHIPEENKKSWKSCRLHIHCPEAATAKDGPSAGVAIATAIVSRLTNVNVCQDVAMTGEIDLSGKVHAIGGLDAKLFGALRAGVKRVLVPEDNKRDVDIFVKKNGHLITIKLVKSVHEAFDDALLREIK